MIKGREREGAQSNYLVFCIRILVVYATHTVCTCKCTLRHYDNVMIMSGVPLEYIIAH